MSELLTTMARLAHPSGFIATSYCLVVSASLALAPDLVSCLRLYRFCTGRALLQVLFSSGSLLDLRLLAFRSQVNCPLLGEA